MKRIFFMCLVALGFLFPLTSHSEAFLPHEEFEPFPQCRALVQDCLLEGEPKRTNCFFSSGMHPFCAGTDLGKLSIKRFQIGNIDTSMAHDSGAVESGQLVDRECIARFDTNLLSRLVPGDVSGSKVELLREELSKCQITETPFLFRS